MSDPGASDVFTYLGDWAWKALTGVLAVFGWDAMSRLKRVEEMKQNSADASTSRAELKAEIAAMGTRMDTQHNSLRESIEARSSELRDRLDAIMDRMNGHVR